ncbi:aminodeoxychorismate synthase component I [Corynebacterium urogenitale]
MLALRLVCRTVAGVVAAPAVVDSLFPDATTLAFLDSSLTSSEPYAQTSSIIFPGGEHSGPLGFTLKHWVVDQGPSHGSGRYEIEDEGAVATSLRSVVAEAHAGRATFYDVLRAGLTPQLVNSQVDDEFSLGWVGAFGYELKHHSEMVRHSPTAISQPHTGDLPDAMLLWADRAIVVDHARQVMQVLYLEPVHRDGSDHEIADNVAMARAQRKWATTTCAQLEELVRAASAQETAKEADYEHPTAHSEHPSAHSVEPSAHHVEAPLRFRFDQNHAQYLASIRRAQQSIAAGDSYEICLTNTAEGPSLSNPWQAYLKLRTTSPVPYGSYLRFGDVHVLSASPERFLSVSEAGQLSAKPIKGTRPRSGMGRNSDWWRRDLMESEKDRAENLMIVDLLRNDLSMVAAPGTVRVTRLLGIESYSHVHQMVSTIEAQLAEGKTAVDALEVAFPGGSMTGAPKVRTMELIEDMERRARGLYSGAIGWLGLGGAADLAITIRTLVTDRSATTFGVGGAIVADSDPEAEWQEILVKASALLEALGAELVDEA